MIIVPGRKATPLERGMQFGLVTVAVLVLACSFAIMLTMDAGSRGQGGRFYVALVALVALGAIDGQIGKVARRRWPLELGTSDQERRYALTSLLLLLLCAGVLLGFALLFP